MRVTSPPASERKDLRCYQVCQPNNSEVSLLSVTGFANVSYCRVTKCSDNWQGICYVIGFCLLKNSNHLCFRGFLAIVLVKVCGITECSAAYHLIFAITKPAPVGWA